MSIHSQARGLLVRAVLILGLAAPAAWAQQRGADHAARPAAAPSTGVSIGGAVQHPRTWSLADLEKQPATTVAIYYNTGRGAVSATFTGTLLWPLLQEAGIVTDPAHKNDALRHTVLVTATDGYAAALSLGELDPQFGAAQALIAYAQDGKPLGDGGVARLIMPADKDGGRNVMRVATIEVR